MPAGRSAQASVTGVSNDPAWELTFTAVLAECPVAILSDVGAASMVIG
jgi:hypothetical protein